MIELTFDVYFWSKKYNNMLGQYRPLFTLTSNPSRVVSSTSLGHNQNWIYGDVIQLSKMAPTRRDTMLGHFSALF